MDYLYEILRYFTVKMPQRVSTSIHGQEHNKLTKQNNNNPQKT